MIIVQPDFKILTDISEGGLTELKQIERAARTCYKSENKIAEDGSTAKRLIKQLILLGHEAMLEHSQLSVLFIVDRGVSHEIVRHRIASYAQESTRYCDYSNEMKFNGHVTFVCPSELIMEHMLQDSLTGSQQYNSWVAACRQSEINYKKLISYGCKPQLARSVLITSTKTELILTANYREWRQIFKLRTAKDAHPDMQYIMRKLCTELQTRIPVIFDDIKWEE